ncbi:phage tail protein [Acinetobacter variabilis]|uniref:phage tail fiber protein n=1 Tax=Acinetobacter variabilis TaxID=70346 RepID=UPI0030FC9470
MAKQTINQGAAPTGAGGDTFRTGSAKLQANDDEIYNYLGDGTNLNKLGTAAFKNTGTQAGNVMEVGSFGLGTELVNTLRPIDSSPKGTGFFGIHQELLFGVEMSWNINGTAIQLLAGINDKRLRYRHNYAGLGWVDYVVYTAQNTTVDPNGFIKAASPIVSLYADKIELNIEAKEQDITFEKLGVGDYLVKGSLGFAQDGWYIETPKDANGNVLVAVVYEQLANGDISVKTYDYMLNKKGRIVADTEAPLDIPESRWIDLRLQELPQPEIEMPKSVTPPDFQPTGLAEAVATVMESYNDLEQ